MVLGTLCCCTGEPSTWECPGFRLSREGTTKCTATNNQWFDVVQITDVVDGTEPAGTFEGVREIINGLHLIRKLSDAAGAFTKQDYWFADGGHLEMWVDPYDFPVPTGIDATIGYEHPVNIETYKWDLPQTVPLDCTAQWILDSNDYQGPFNTPFPYWAIEPQVATITWNPGSVPTNWLPFRNSANFNIALGQASWVEYDQMTPTHWAVRLTWFGQLYRWFTSVVLDQDAWYVLHTAYCDDNNSLSGQDWRVYYDDGNGRVYLHRAGVFGEQTFMPFYIPLGAGGTYEIGIEMQGGIFEDTKLSLYDFFLQKLN